MDNRPSYKSKRYQQNSVDNTNQEYFQFDHQTSQNVNDINPYGNMGNTNPLKSFDSQNEPNRHPSSRKSRQERKELSKLKNRNAQANQDNVYGSSNSNIILGKYSANQDSGSKVQNLSNEIMNKSTDRVVTSDKNNRHRLYNYMSYRQEEDITIKEDNHEREITCMKVVNRSRGSHQNENSSDSAKEIRPIQTQNKPTKATRVAETKSLKRPCLQDFIFDFESMNNEMIQNQFDKANILGYGNQFFSNPANQPTPKSSFVQQVRSSSRIRGRGSLEEDENENELQKDSPINPRWEKAQDNEGSLAKYFMNKLAKSGSVQFFPNQQSKSSSQNEVKKSQEISKKQIENKTTKFIGGHASLKNLKAEISQDQLKNSMQIKGQNEAPKYQLKNASEIKTGGGIQHVRGASASKTLKGVGSLKTIRASYSFMSKNQSVGPQGRAANNGLSYQSQFRTSIPKLPGSSNRKNQNNHSINSRFINPRPDNNLSKNSNIQMQTDRMKQSDVIPEQKSLKSDSYEQVSMGSLGAGEANPDDLKYDKVMEMKQSFAQPGPKNVTGSYMPKVKRNNLGSAKTFMREPRGLLPNKQTQSKMPEQIKKDQKVPGGSYLQNAYSSSPTKYSKKLGNMQKTKYNQPQVPNLQFYNTGSLQKKSGMQSTNSLLKKQQFSSKNPHMKSVTSNNDLDTQSNQGLSKRSQISPAPKNSKYMNKFNPQNKSVGNLKLLSYSLNTPKKDLSASKNNQDSNSVKRAAYQKKYGLKKADPAPVEQNKNIEIFSQAQSRSKTFAFRTSIHDIQEEPSESAAQTYASNNHAKDKNTIDVKRRNHTIVPEKIQEKVSVRAKRASISNTQSDQMFKSFAVGGAPAMQQSESTKIIKQKQKGLKSSRASIDYQNQKAFVIQDGQLRQKTGSKITDRLSAKKQVKDAPKTARNTSTAKTIARKESIQALTTAKNTKRKDSTISNPKQTYREISSKKLSLQANQNVTKVVPVLSGQGFRQRIFNQTKNKKNLLFGNRKGSLANMNDIGGFQTERTPFTYHVEPIQHIENMGESKQKNNEEQVQTEKKDSRNGISATPSSKKQITTSTIDLVNDPIPDTQQIQKKQKELPKKPIVPIQSSIKARKASLGSLNLVSKKTAALEENTVKTVSLKVNNDKAIVVKSSANPQGPGSNLSGNLTSKSPKSVMTFRSAQKRGSSIEHAENEIQYPLSVEEAKKHFKEFINDYEDQEIMKYDGEIYYVGQNCENKTKGHVIKMVNQTIQSNIGQKRSSYKMHQIASDRQIERLKQMNIFNYGYDDDQGDYKTVIKDHLGYRYEVLDHLGSGSFGQAVKCIDHKTGDHVAVKIIRNKKKFQYQAGMELKILKFLNNNDKFDQNNVIRVYDYLVFREHLIISFELLSINLYEFIRNNNFQGVSQSLIRRFAIQILQALKYQQDYNLVHCDLKPENILLKQQNKSGIKVIDYGSSCFMGQRIYTYIQSRFYRAPEIILGVPYTTAIDMWSFGAIVAELFTGFPLFPGESEVEQLAYIMELYGLPQDEVLKLSQRRHLFFHKNNEPILSPNSRGKIRQPGSKKLNEILKCDDEIFLDFLNKCFEWHPLNRMTPLQALQHPWILEGLPEKVLKHHNKMFGHAENKKMIADMTYTSIQGFPRSKKDQTIHEIVREIRLADKKREAINDRKKAQTNNKSSQRQSSEERKSLKRQQDTSASPSKQKLQNVYENNTQSVEQAYQVLTGDPQKTNKQNISPQKERKSRKQRKETKETAEINNSMSQGGDQDTKVAYKTGQISPQIKAQKVSEEYNDGQENQVEKYGKIRVYEPANDDQIPEEEHTLSDGPKIQSEGGSRIQKRPNLFKQKTANVVNQQNNLFKCESEAVEANGDDDILSDNNGEVTEFIGSYDQVQEISENNTVTEK